MHPKMHPLKTMAEPMVGSTADTTVSTIPTPRQSGERPRKGSKTLDGQHNNCYLLVI